MEMQECIHFVLIMHVAVDTIIDTERTYMETTIQSVYCRTMYVIDNSMKHA